MRKKVMRQLLDIGEEPGAVKVLHDPAELGDRLSALGWRADIRTVSSRLFYADIERAATT